MLTNTSFPHFPSLTPCFKNTDDGKPLEEHKLALSAKSGDGSAALAGGAVATASIKAPWRGGIKELRVRTEKGPAGVCPCLFLFHVEG